MINEQIWYFTDRSRLEFQELAQSVFSNDNKVEEALEVGLAQE